MSIPAIANEAQDLLKDTLGIDFRKSFVSKPLTGKKIVGFNETAFQQVDPKYKVVIENSEFIVNAWLQDGFEFDTSSNWGALLGIMSGGAVSEVAELATKAVAGVSLKNVAMTRRKWENSTPLQVNLKLKFRAYEDADIEVLQACKALQSMTLPAEVDTFIKGVLMPGVLIPPGPNEMYLSTGTASASNQFLAWNKGASKQKLLGSGDIISIELFGGQFYLDMVIIKNVKVKFDSKLTAKGPVAAEVNVTLESYEVLTKQKLEKAYAGLGYTSNAGASGARVDNVKGL